MKKIVFQGQECFIAYKSFKNPDLKNYQGNYTYELNNWYESLDVDVSDHECSYGLNLCQSPLETLDYGYIIYECYVPIENNIIHFIQNQDKFRTKKMFLSDVEFVYDFNDLTENQRTEYLNIIKHSTNQLLTLINDIIDFSKIEAGLIEVRKNKFSINQLIFDLANIYSLQLKKMNSKRGIEK